MQTSILKDLKPKERVQSSFFPLIEPHLFSQVTKRMRLFFEQKGFLEVHTQNRLSIMAACEDPHTIATYNYAGDVWPLPQTGQMWLEYELLTQPEVPGFFCVSTSYRNEPNPVEGRHCLIFPMFEFELHGGIKELIKMEEELLEFLGFGKKGDFPMGNYVDVAKEYGVKELTNDQEAQLAEDHGSIFFLNYFPEYTSPFWNMKINEDDPPSLIRSMSLCMAWKPSARLNEAAMLMRCERASLLLKMENMLRSFMIYLVKNGSGKN